MARLVRGQPLERPREFFQGSFVAFYRAAGGRYPFALGLEKGLQLTEVGEAQLDVGEIAGDVVGDGAYRGRNHHELAGVEAPLVEVTQPAPDLGRGAHRLVEVFEVEDGPVGVRGDEVESGPRLACLDDGTAVAPHTVGEAPGPHRNRRREEALGRFAQASSDALFLGRT